MNSEKALSLRALHAIVVLFLIGVLAVPIDAKYKAIIGGVTVSYSNDGALAYFDPKDNTLTVVVAQSGGSLSITVGSSAFFSWGSYVDVYIIADDVSLKSLKIKGSITCAPFVCGQVGYVPAFTLTGGVVGDTDAYGQGFGLGRSLPFGPAKISIKNGHATAQVLGFPHPEELNQAVKSASVATGPETQQLQTVAQSERLPSAAKQHLIQCIRGAPVVRAERRNRADVRKARDLETDRARGAWIHDPAGLQGYAASNAVAGTAP